MDQLNPNTCELLDAFLDGELNAAEMASFEAHLSECADCRESVRQQRWIDGALRAHEVTAQTAPSTVLMATAEAITDVRRQQQRRRMLTTSLAAAASVALLAAWQNGFFDDGQWRVSSSGSLPLAGRAGEGEAPWYTLPSPLPNPPHQGEGTSGSSVNRSSDPKLAATFTAGGSGIAIPVASDSPDVTIVQFYSTTETDRRLQRQRELEAKYRELIGG